MLGIVEQLPEICKDHNIEEIAIPRPKNRPPYFGSAFTGAALIEFIVLEPLLVPMQNPAPNKPNGVYIG